MNVKVCSKCGELKLDQIDFNLRNRHNRYRYYSYCIECGCKQSKDWRKDNVEHIKEYDKSDISKQNHDRYRKQNHDKFRQKNRRYRTSKANIPGLHTIEELKFIYKMQHGKCSCCNESFPFEKLTVDHINPISKTDSTDWPWNIQLLCGICNSRKGNRHNIDYRDIQPVFLSEIINKL